MGKDTHARLRAGAAHRARGAGGQRRRDHHPARRRLHADARHLARHPRPQPRARRPPRRRHRHHAVAQSAGGRRLQVQSDQRRAGRHRRHPMDPGSRQRAAARRQCGRASALPLQPPWAGDDPPATISCVPTSTTCATSSTWTPFAARGSRWRRPARRRRRGLLGADQRDLRPGPRRRQSDRSIRPSRS